MGIKGISTVVGFLLILVIVIGMVGVAYTFISGVFTGSTATVFEIIDAYDGSLIIKNSGTEHITKITAKLDGDDENIAVIPNIQGLVAYWSFNENSGSITVDNSGNGNDGVLNGGLDSTGWKTGKFGNALQFDGTDDYIAIQNLNYDTVGEISQVTACAWFKTSFAGSLYDSNWAFIDFDRSEYFNLFIRGDDGRLGFSTQQSDRTFHDMYSNTALNDDKWHFGCGVYDGTDKYIYVDGKEDTSALNPHGGQNLGTGTARYGFVGDGSEASNFDGTRNNKYYDGFIDEASIYNRALTESEIEQLYSGLVSPGQLVTVKPLTPLTQGRHAIRLCTSSMCSTGYLTG